jgi:hypothetical protein
MSLWLSFVAPVIHNTNETVLVEAYGIVAADRQRPVPRRHIVREMLRLLRFSARYLVVFGRARTEIAAADSRRVLIVIFHSGFGFVLSVARTIGQIERNP